jgi:hypothetical protein
MHKNSKTPPPTKAEIDAWVRYDPDAGRFYRLADAGRWYRAGQELTGTINSKGYIMLGFRGRPISAARTAFLLMDGKWPEAIVDHINGVRDDNRWRNLRLATASQNCSHRTGRIGKSGFRGVKVHPGNKTNPYFANITVEGKIMHLGFFPTPEEAAQAYRKAATIHHGEFTNRDIS